jgi:uncharacterized protein GlcG (DUF336 family)
MSQVTLDDATEMVAAAEERAEEIGVPMCITVLDGGANLVAFHRMDGALLASIDIARGKAYTALAMQMPTEDLAEMAQPGEELYGIEATNDGRIVVFGGGFPIEGEGEPIGAIGVSGGSVEEDVTVAEAGLDAL